MTRLTRWRYGRIGARYPHRRVTVILTAYNAEDTVEAAVQSVLGQTHSNVALMAFDDASTDGTADRLVAMAREDWRIQVYRASDNRGTYAAKNWCLSRARGRYVTFQDSDDLSDPDRLQLQVGLLAKSCAPACTVRWRREDGVGTPLMVDGRMSRLAAISLMIDRKRVLPVVGHFDPVRIAADTEYLGRIPALMGPGALLKSRITAYTGRVRSGSLTTAAGSGMDWVRSGNNVTRTVTGDRKAYLDAARDWHVSTAVTALDGTQNPAAPFAPEAHRAAPHTHVDCLWPSGPERGVWS